MSCIYIGVEGKVISGGLENVDKIDMKVSKTRGNPRVMGVRILLGLILRRVGSIHNCNCNSIS